MKWYLHPQGQEFSKWHPRAIARHIGNISLPQGEPTEALMGEHWHLLPLDDTPPTLEEGDVVQARVFVIDEDKAKATVEYEIGERPRKEIIQERLQKASDECRKRIMAVVDETAQANMTAFAAAGLFTPEQREVYKAGLLWVAQMRGTWRGLANDRRKSIEADQNWPSPPSDLVELVKQF